MFEVYKVDIYSKLGQSTFQTPIEEYTKTEKDIKLKEIFIFDLDSSLLKISSYPNKESEVKLYDINCVKKINDSIIIKSKIKLNNDQTLYEFTAHINISNDEPYIFILLYDEILDESIFLYVTHFYFEK